MTRQSLLEPGAMRLCGASAMERLEPRLLMAAELDATTQLPYLFTNELPRPGVIQPITPGGRRYEVSISQFRQNLGVYDPETQQQFEPNVWGYNGSYPGPTFEARRHRPIRVLWKNELVDQNGSYLPHLLPVDTSIHWAYGPEGMQQTTIAESGVPVVTHLHGAHSEAASDGLPEAWFSPNFQRVGPDWVKRVYRYDNTQEAGTLWYHDHTLGITRLNVYAGLAGFYLLRDAHERRLNLPSGQYEIPLAIQDRSFSEDGELFYPSDPPVEGAPDPSVLPEFFGDFILVNGKAWPFVDVEPRKYRLRLLNGSDSRFYHLSFESGQSFWQIGTDDGLLPAPVSLTSLTLGPGERADVVIDFAGLNGQRLVLRNDAPTPFPDGDPPVLTGPETDPESYIMQFRVSDASVADPSSLPAQLRAKPFSVPGPVRQTRQVALFEMEDEFGRLLPQLGTPSHGALLWSDPITENPALNTTEIWELYNNTADTHPIHPHLINFRILNRQQFTADVDPQTGVMSDIELVGNPTPPAANELGPKDTVQVFPGQVVRFVARFDRRGEYVWHCHILSHEDHEMMRRYLVGRSPRQAPQSPLLSSADHAEAASVKPVFSGTPITASTFGRSPLTTAVPSQQAAELLRTEDTDARPLLADTEPASR